VRAVGQHRTRKNRDLPPGLYRWTQNGIVYYRMAVGTTANGSRRFHQLGPVTESEALQAYHAHHAGLTLPRSRSDFGIGVYEWLSHYYLPHVQAHRAHGTFRVERNAAEWLATYFKGTPLEAIDGEAIEGYKRWRRQNPYVWRKGPEPKEGEPDTRERVERPAGARTINLDLLTLSKSLKHAVTMGHLAKVPTIVRIPERRERREPKWLTVEETRRVLAAAIPERRLLLLFAFHTGLRPGEIRTRCRDDVDLDRRTVRVDDRPELEFFVKRDRKRIVPLTPALAAELGEAWPTLPAEGPLFAGQNLKMVLRRTCARAGVKVISPYGTRHTFASRWAYEGRSREALIKIMGHRDGRMIERVYAHFGADELSEHVDRVVWETEGQVVELPRRRVGR
jgi:integrase